MIGNARGRLSVSHAAVSVRTEPAHQMLELPAAISGTRRHVNLRFAALRPRLLAQQAFETPPERVSGRVSTGGATLAFTAASAAAF
jgi:hypothetical protein